MPGRFDVVVAGAGPAGRALATACAERGLSVLLAAPDTDTSWPNTYGAWADELAPMGLQGATAASWPTAIVRTEQATLRLPRSYTLIDNGRLLARLRARLAAAGGSEVARGVLRATPDRVVLSDGREATAGVVVDATGRGGLLPHPPGPPVAWQSAYGVLATFASPPAEAGAMTLMDLRQLPAWDPAEPTFLYAMDLGGGRWFAEETSLARAQPLAADLLADRLRERLAAAGAGPGPAEAVEHCLIPLGTPVPPAQPVLAYGAAASLIHPATGYQVGAALSLAPSLAQALAGALRDGPPGTAAARGWEALWGPDRRRRRALHELGLACLLRCDADRLGEFLGTFFSLPEGRWRAYLSGEGSLGDTRRAMLAVFARATGLRRLLLTTALRAAARRPAGIAPS